MVGQFSSGFSGILLKGAHKSSQVELSAVVSDAEVSDVHECGAIIFTYVTHANVYVMCIYLLLYSEIQQLSSS